MEKRIFEFLEKMNFDFLFTSCEQRREYIDRIVNNLNMVKSAMAGEANGFSEYLLSQMEMQMDKHSVQIPCGTRLKSGEFYYRFASLDECLADAEKRRLPKSYKTKFFTVSDANIAQT